MCGIIFKISLILFNHSFTNYNYICVQFFLLNLHMEQVPNGTSLVLDFNHFIHTQN